MAKDPICKMTVSKEESKKKGLAIGNNYFCSNECKEKFLDLPWYKTQKFSKVFPPILAITLISGTFLSIYYDFMIQYMGWFFIIFSLAKMTDWKGFITAFQQYDLIGNKSKLYATTYPGIEFLIGLLFLFNIYIVQTAIITLLIMGIGSIGITIKLLKKEKFQCACLGTKINLPLTKVTLLEDLLMSFMAIYLIINA